MGGAALKCCLMANVYLCMAVMSTLVSVCVLGFETLYWMYPPCTGQYINSSAADRHPSSTLAPTPYHRKRANHYTNIARLARDPCIENISGKSNGRSFHSGAAYSRAICCRVDSLTWKSNPTQSGFQKNPITAGPERTP